MLDSGVYCIINKKTGRQYIGQTKNIKSRFATHKSYLKNNKHSNKDLQEDWNKYGADAFYFGVLKRCGLKDLDKYERIHTNRVDEEMRYSLTSGGRVNTKFSDEYKRRISEGVLNHIHR